MLKPAIQIRSHDPNRQLITQTRELLNRAIKACFCSSFLVAGVMADGLLCITCEIICPINLGSYLLYMNIIYLQFDKPDSSTKSEKCTYKRMSAALLKKNNLLLPVLVQKRQKYTRMGLKPKSHMPAVCSSSIK